MSPRSFRPLFLAIPLLVASLTAVYPASGAEFDPRSHDDLSTVIMLCAAAPESPGFDAAWINWVRANPTADTNAAIRAVLSRAGTLHSMAVPGMQPRQAGSRPDPKAVAERMRYLARKARY